MSLASEVGAIRNSAGLSHGSHIAVVRVDGPDALEFLQIASTQSPYMREGRVRHTLLLREDGTVYADAFIVKVEEAFLVLAEGPDEQAVVAWLSAFKADKQVTIQGMAADWITLGIDGPYAWEVVAGLLGPVVLGLPYLALLRREEILCLRAGKTGEYGYLLLMPRAGAPEALTKLAEIGKSLDLMTVTREALDVCALENWHFSMRSFTGPLTPIELQLQWRIVYTREFFGAAALRARRAEGAKTRVTCFTSTDVVAVGQRVELDGIDVGEVLAVCASPTLGLTVGSALLERRVAHPHLTFSAGSMTLRTCTASLVDNRSLEVDPHKHSYATRGT